MNTIYEKKKRAASNEFQLIFLEETSTLLGKIAHKENELGFGIYQKKDLSDVQKQVCSNTIPSI